MVENVLNKWYCFLAVRTVCNNISMRAFMIFFLFIVQKEKLMPVGDFPAKK